MATVRSILIAIATGALWVAGCAAPVAPADQRAVVPVPAAKPDVQLSVVSAQFGVFGADSLGRRVLFETDKFPAIVAAPFGWLVLFKTDKPTVIWREEFELPEVPPTWGPGEAMGIFQVSPDRRTAVTERIIPSRLGFVGNEWRYAPGDPTGAHKMRVYIDGQLIKEFKFDIEVGTEQPDRLPGSRSRGSRT